MAIIEGKAAPDFASKDQNGDDISLSDFKGQKLALYFYPKDLTPGCTTQSCDLRDNYDILKEKGIEIVGVSADSQKMHLKFIDKHSLPFRLIVDEEKIIIKAFEVWGRKKFMGKEFDGIFRRTFLIDENGVIEKIIEKVKTKDHSNQILEVLGLN
ncbi:MAG: thioredoxin-dependent thiol peroxidase [Flavobacteriales bacterium]|nr:thioredoxin-dependent thiol peroxidase [Flavobacteriales bacterium]